MREEDGWWLRPRKKRNNRAEGRVKALLPLLVLEDPYSRPALPLGTITRF
jgi:hypothetical protein